MENYIELNGRKIGITDKQSVEILEALDKILTPEKSPFDREDNYYAICQNGIVSYFRDFNDRINIDGYENANYCTDEELMKQRAFYEKVERNLWRFSMENGGSGDWVIYYDTKQDRWKYYRALDKHFGPSFKTNEIARRAIREVLIPLIEKESKYWPCDLFEWSI